MLKFVSWAVALTLVLSTAAAAPKARAEDAPHNPLAGGNTAAPAHPAGTATTGPAATAAAHEGGSHEEHGGGSLVDVKFAQAVWVLVIFLIVLAILYPTAWKNVLTGLKAREQRIRTDIAEAEAARTKAEATLREYNTQLATAEARVREMLSTATVDAERIAAQIRARGEQEAQEAKERATREIESAGKAAIAQIYDQTANLATSVAEKILRRSLNADDQRDLVTRSLDQVQNIKNN